jgi:hypothetical protein
MNKGLVAAGAIAVVALGSPAFAQFGALSRAQ